MSTEPARSTPGCRDVATASGGESSCSDGKYCSCSGTRPPTGTHMTIFCFIFSDMSIAGVAFEVFRHRFLKAARIDLIVLIVMLGYDLLINVRIANHLLTVDALDGRGDGCDDFQWRVNPASRANRLRIKCGQMSSNYRKGCGGIGCIARGSDIATPLTQSRRTQSVIAAGPRGARQDIQQVGAGARSILLQQSGCAGEGEVCPGQPAGPISSRQFTSGVEQRKGHPRTSSNTHHPRSSSKVFRDNPRISRPKSCPSVREEKTSDLGKLARTSVKNYASVIAHNPDSKRTRIKLSSGAKKVLPSANRAMVGIKPILKAGRAYHKVKRNCWPKKRGATMNPVEHPHGGDNHQHNAAASESAVTCRAGISHADFVGCSYGDQSRATCSKPAKSSRRSALVNQVIRRMVHQTRSS
ncbi:hypothetical protein pipiens_019261, partial [Culex pipiens pipiens]